MANNANGPDRDADGAALNVVAAVLATAAGAQVIISADGSFNFAPAAGYLGPDASDYTVVEPSGATDTGHVVLNVVNHAPLAVTDHFSLGCRSSVTGNVLASNGQGPDSDGDALAVVAGRHVTDKGSILTIAANGSFTFKAGGLSYGIEVVSYTLVDAMGAMSTGSIQLSVGNHGGDQGTALAESRSGSAGGDIAIMAGGDDMVEGLGGLDVIGGGTGDDVIKGGLGNDRLYGEGGKDELFGGAGADRLDRGAGRDLLKGAGADRFVIAVGPAHDSDRVADSAAVDRLVSKASDLGLASGPLADASWLVASGAAEGGHRRFVHDARTRSLSWDDDGLAATVGQLMAVFDTKVALTLDSFVLV